MFFFRYPACFWRGFVLLTTLVVFCILLLLRNAVIAQLVERVHGKDEVSSSILDNGSIHVFVRGLVFFFGGCLVCYCLYGIR
jgi:hypothetical protein